MGSVSLETDVTRFTSLTHVMTKSALDGDVIKDTQTIVSILKNSEDVNLDRSVPTDMKKMKKLS